jgi:cobalt/nickel transport system permease protein
MTADVLALHIPDGFLSPGVALVGWVVGALLVWLALRQTRLQFLDRQIPLMGVLAAFIFAAQALNFPIAGGTSGHVLGAALAGILLGPWAGSVVMVAVVLVQGLLFQDGGLFAMGCNLLNMAFLAVFAASSAFTLMHRLTGGVKLAALVGSWLSVEVGAAATAVQLGLSGTYPLSLSLPALTGVYALVGVVEAVVTVAALSLLESARPDLTVAARRPAGQWSAIATTLALLAALGLALLAPFASSSPDGLEVVAEEGGFARMAQPSFFELFPDYTVGFLSHWAPSTMLAMVIGTLAVFAVVRAVGRFAARRAED